MVSVAVGGNREQMASTGREVTIHQPGARSSKRDRRSTSARFSSSMPSMIGTSRRVLSSSE